MSILETHRRIRLARGGRLLPWLGPALRGLAGERLRARVCQLPVAEQIARWQYCTGCPHMRGCAYGQTYEPDPPAGLHLAAGWENTARPIVIAPRFPVPEFGHVGLAFDVSVTFLGQAAMEHTTDFWEAMRIGGADLAIGLGEDHVLFDLETGEPDRKSTMHLPFEVDSSPDVPTVRIELTAPLFLNEARSDGRKRPVLSPSFGQLLRAGLRVLGPLHKLYATPLPDSVFGRVKTAAEAVQTRRAEFHEYRQAKWSHRTKERLNLIGTIGWAEYGPVPSWLLPWLTWAGRVHVGTHRVAGAGGWKVETLD